MFRPGGRFGLGPPLMLTPGGRLGLGPPLTLIPGGRLGLAGPPLTLIPGGKFGLGPPLTLMPGGRFGLGPPGPPLTLIPGGRFGFGPPLTLIPGGSLGASLELLPTEMPSFESLSMSWFFSGSSDRDTWIPKPASLSMPADLCTDLGLENGNPSAITRQKDLPRVCCSPSDGYARGQVGGLLRRPLYRDARGQLPLRRFAGHGGLQPRFLAANLKRVVAACSTTHHNQLTDARVRSTNITCLCSRRESVIHNYDILIGPKV